MRKARHDQTIETKWRNSWGKKHFPRNTKTWVMVFLFISFPWIKPTCLIKPRASRKFEVPVRSLPANGLSAQTWDVLGLVPNIHQPTTSFGGSWYVFVYILQKKKYRMPLCNTCNTDIVYVFVHTYMLYHKNNPRWANLWVDVYGSDLGGWVPWAFHLFKAAFCQVRGPENNQKQTKKGRLPGSQARTWCPRSRKKGGRSRRSSPWGRARVSASWARIHGPPPPGWEFLGQRGLLWEVALFF